MEISACSFITIIFFLTVMFLIKTLPLKRFFGLRWTLIRKGGGSELEKPAGKIFECHLRGRKGVLNRKGVLIRNMTVIKDQIQFCF